MNSITFLKVKNFSFSRKSKNYNNWNKKRQKNKLYLMPENKKCKPIELKEENELIIWGVVEFVIKKVKILVHFKFNHPFISILPI